MDQWNKGGLSRDEFMKMREKAIRELQEISQKHPQTAAVEIKKEPLSLQSTGNVIDFPVEKEETGLHLAKSTAEPGTDFAEENKPPAVSVVAQPKEDFEEVPANPPELPPNLRAGLPATNPSGETGFPAPEKRPFGESVAVFAPEREKSDRSAAPETARNDVKEQWQKDLEESRAAPENIEIMPPYIKKAAPALRTGSGARTRQAPFHPDAENRMKYGTRQSYHPDKAPTYPSRQEDAPFYHEKNPRWHEPRTGKKK